MRHAAPLDQTAEPFLEVLEFLRQFIVQKRESHDFFLRFPLAKQSLLVIGLVNVNSGFEFGRLRFLDHRVLMQLKNLLHVSFALLFQFGDQVFDLVLIFVNLLFKRGLLMRYFFDLSGIAQKDTLLVLKLDLQRFSLLLEPGRQGTVVILQSFDLHLLRLDLRGLVAGLELYVGDLLLVLFVLLDGDLQRPSLCRESLQ